MWVHDFIFLSTPVCVCVLLYIRDYQVECDSLDGVKPLVGSLIYQLLARELYLSLMAAKAVIHRTTVIIHHTHLCMVISRLLLRLLLASVFYSERGLVPLFCTTAPDVKEASRMLGG